MNKLKARCKSFIGCLKKNPKKIIIAIIIVALIIVAFVVGVYVVNRNNTKVNKDAQNSSDVVVVKTAESYTKDGEITIKEWGLKMPVYKKYLDDVVYSIINDESDKSKSTLIFSSSILTNADFSNPSCDNIKKDSWGVIRTKKDNNAKSSDSSKSSYSYDGEYKMQFMRPDNICDDAFKIDESFYKMYSEMKKI